jgi:hypothetical protein
LGLGLAGNALDSTGAVFSLAALPNGDLAVGGNFTAAGDNLAAYFAQYHFGTPVVSHPMSAAACPSEMASFNATATSDTPLTYAWRHDATPIDPMVNPSAATDTLLLSSVQPSDAGSYDCIITNACGSVTSNAATLTIRPPYDRACGGPGCDPDVNHDGNTDQADIAYLINVVAGGDNLTGIDPDFNADGNVDQSDIDALINVIAGGNCP